MPRVNLKRKLSIEELYKLYYLKRFSTRQIGKLYQCDHTTVRKLMQEYNMNPRNPSGAGKKEIVLIERDGFFLEAKECTVCGIIRPLEEFNKCAKSSGGRQPKCKSCRIGYYNKNKDSISIKSSLNYFKNHEHNKAVRRKYYVQNREIIRESARQYYMVNKDQIRQQAKKWYTLNKNKISALAKQKRREDPEHFRDKERKRYTKRREQQRKYHKQYYLNNSDRLKINEKKGKRLLKVLPKTLTTEIWFEISNEFNGQCALSNETDGLNFEHFIPKTWGHGGTYRGNVYPLYWELNRSKSDYNPFEWIKRKDVQEKVNMDKWVYLIEYLARSNGLTILQFQCFVYWCEQNKRTEEEIKQSGNKTSLDLWKETLT